jgi:hypothetical protein
MVFLASRFTRVRSDKCLRSRSFACFSANFDLVNSGDLFIRVIAVCINLRNIKRFNNKSSSSKTQCSRAQTYTPKPHQNSDLLHAKANTDALYHNIGPHLIHLSSSTQTSSITISEAFLRDFMYVRFACWFRFSFF